MICASPLHSCDFAPLVLRLSAMASHSTGILRLSSKDGEMKGRAPLQSSGHLGREVGNKKTLQRDQPITPIFKPHPRISHPPNGPVRAKRVMRKWTLISIRVQTLPYNLHAAQLSRSYLQSQP